MTDSWPSEVVFFLDIERYLWGLAIVFFVVGDLVTTQIGFRLYHVVEVGPVVAPIIRQYGTTVMVGLKSAVLVGCLGLHSVAPRPHNVGVPLGLAVLGILVTGWNLIVIVVTTF